mmetsp:Transcript_27509/g.27175  ORF Transcript_27509/g.27175 Transcript_27509/m.27175 type:complete len:308 (+) Transcript_27509:58-981(+)|eukprot:CAMPEP_0202947778 /NCGR_PEP_ID=MMETSP1395-20130829/12167_1 /ASSEMBLY_ACC=CAM_ASM_000871 /TAXON_ID=5961 /ORGANISM="Blepharisma japonicum, Strain Stock R1072" /LENGTH=307 /DNA_ID=CAMNT_0049649289 /DNA_START=42 /DNA_END=965 /DNA_ORIENTATION=+
MACFLLKQTDTYKDAEIIRTRDKAILDTLDIVVDVGDVYDPSQNRFDHHQKSFTDTFGGKYTSVRMSSAGLIWKHFGKEVLSKFTEISDENILDLMYLRMYRDLFQCLDGIDNGVPQYRNSEHELYKENTGLASRISRLNPSWNKPEDPMPRFIKAMELAGEDFKGILFNALEEWLPARDIVVRSILARGEVDQTLKIIRLERTCPWKDHLYTIEEEMGIDRILYVLYQDGDGRWRIQCVGENGVMFQNRLSLPEAWRGKRDEELAAISGIPGTIFVHNTGFIGGAQTYEGVLEMARASIKMQVILD